MKKLFSIYFTATVVAFFLFSTSIFSQEPMQDIIKRVREEQRQSDFDRFYKEVKIGPKEKYLAGQFKDANGNEYQVYQNFPPPVKVKKPLPLKKSETKVVPVPPAPVVVNITMSMVPNLAPTTHYPFYYDGYGQWNWLLFLFIGSILGWFAYWFFLRNGGSCDKGCSNTPSITVSPTFTNSPTFSPEFSPLQVSRSVNDINNDSSENLSLYSSTETLNEEKH
jgi:hypothetical protein